MGSDGERKEGMREGERSEGREVRGRGRREVRGRREREVGREGMRRKERGKGSLSNKPMPRLSVSTYTTGAFFLLVLPNFPS